MNNFERLLVEAFRTRGSRAEEKHLIPEYIMIDSGKRYSIPRHLAKGIKLEKENVIIDPEDQYMNVTNLDVYRLDSSMSESAFLQLIEELGRKKIFYQYTTDADYQRNIRDRENRKRLGV